MKKLFLFLFFFTILFTSVKNTAYSATTYHGTNPAGNPARMECDDFGNCSCYDTASTVSFGSNFSACTDNDVNPNNVCCTSGSCSTSDPNHPTIGIWDWDYASECFARLTGIGNRCISVFNYNYTQCGARDACLSTSSNPYLNAGQCGSSGCATGGVYKTCCNSSGTLGPSCNQVGDSGYGFQYGVCPSSTTTVMCGVSSGTCAAVAPFPCTTASCGLSACQAWFGPAPTSTTAPSAPTATTVPGAPTPTATTVPSAPTPTATAVPAQPKPPPLLQVCMKPNGAPVDLSCNDSESITIQPGEKFTLPLSFKNQNNLCDPGPCSSDGISQMNLLWNIPPFLQVLEVKKPDGSPASCVITTSDVQCSNLYPSDPLGIGSVDGRIVVAEFKPGVGTGSYNIPRAKVMRNAWNNNPQFPDGSDGRRTPGDQWGRSLSCLNLFPPNCALGDSGYNQNYTFWSNTATVNIQAQCPNRPTNVTPPSTNQRFNCANSIRLEWDAMVHAEWYDIRVDDGNISTDTASPATSGGIACGSNTHDICVDRFPALGNCDGSRCSMVINVTPDKSYEWWIHASGDSCPGSTETRGSFNTLCDLPPPGNLQANCNPTTGILTFTWNAVAGATRYAIRVNDEADDWKEVPPNPGPNPGDTIENFVSNSPFTRSTSVGPYYSWWLHAVDDTGKYSPRADGPRVNCPPATHSLNVSPKTNYQNSSGAWQTVNITKNSTSANTNVGYLNPPGRCDVGTCDPANGWTRPIGNCSFSSSGQQTCSWNIDAGTAIADEHTFGLFTSSGALLAVDHATFVPFSATPIPTQLPSIPASPTPVGDFGCTLSADPPSGEDEVTTRITVTGSGLASRTATVNYSIDFGDGTTSSLGRFTGPNTLEYDPHTYRGARTYQAIFTAIDSRDSSTVRRCGVNIPLSRGPSITPAPPTCQIITPPNNGPTVVLRADGHTVDIEYRYQVGGGGGGDDTYNPNAPVRFAKEDQNSGFKITSWVFQKWGQATNVFAAFVPPNVRADFYRGTKRGFVEEGQGTEVGTQFGSYGVAFDRNPPEKHVEYYQAKSTSGENVAYSNTYAVQTNEDKYRNCTGSWSYSLASIQEAKFISSTATTVTFDLLYHVGPSYSYCGPTCFPTYTPAYLEIRQASASTPSYIPWNNDPGSSTNTCINPRWPYGCYLSRWTTRYTLDLPPGTTENLTITGYSGPNQCSWQSAGGSATLQATTQAGTALVPTPVVLRAQGGDRTHEGKAIVPITWTGSRPGEQVKVFRSQTRWTKGAGVADNRTYQDGFWIFRGIDDLNNLAPGTYYYGVDLDLYGLVGACDTRYVSTDQTPLRWNGFALSGNIFWDRNRDGVKGGADEFLFTNGLVEVSARDSSGKIVDTFTCDGARTSCSGTYLLHVGAGVYDIEFKVPDGYSSTYPVGARDSGLGSPSYRVTAGTPCADPALDPISKNVANPCSNGNLTGIDFAIISYPWFQGTGGDMRLDTEFSTKIPNSVAIPPGQRFASLAGSGGTSGVIYAGGGQPDFGNGQASPQGWVVTGNKAKFTPVNTGIIRTSYNYILTTTKQSGVTPVDLKTLPGCASLLNCSLPDESQFPSGVYKTDYSVVLTSPGNRYVFAPGKNYVILVNGDLVIKEELIVPAGSTVTFSVSGDIIVDKSVGAATLTTTCTTPPGISQTSTGCHIEGFYSADGSIILDGNHSDCTLGIDKRVNLAGAFVSNAKLREGESFENRRDLCTENRVAPSFTVLERADLLFNAPEFLKSPTFIWQEVAP